MYLYFFISIYLFIYIFISIYLFIYIFISISIYIYLNLYLYLSISMVTAPPRTTIVRTRALTIYKCIRNNSESPIEARNRLLKIKQTEKRKTKSIFGDSLRIALGREQTTQNHLGKKTKQIESQSQKLGLDGKRYHFILLLVTALRALSQWCLICLLSNALAWILGNWLHAGIFPQHMPHHPHHPVPTSP